MCLVVSENWRPKKRIQIQWSHRRDGKNNGYALYPRGPDIPRRRHGQRRKWNERICGSGLGEEQHGADDTGKIVQSILRFVQVPDKRTKFCAMLLKSYLYYHQRFRYFDDGDGNGDGSMTSTSNPPSNVPIVEEGSSIPIVILPRTQYGKPFIPNTTATTTTAPQQTIHS